MALSVASHGEVFSGLFATHAVFKQRCTHQSWQSSGHRSPAAHLTQVCCVLAAASAPKRLGRRLLGRRWLRGATHRLAGPADTPRFGRQSYWESLYQTSNANVEEDDNFEWFCSYDMLKPFVDEFGLQPALARATGRLPRIMIAGCGNSRLGIDMYDDNIDVDGSSTLDIWNVDYASSAIDGSVKAAQQRSMEHVVADLCALPKDTFQEASFDVIVDKGTLDSLACTGSHAVEAVGKEFLRVVRPGGRVVVVSGVASAQQVLDAFQDWQVVLDGSPYINEEGDATIQLRAPLYVFERPPAL